MAENGRDILEQPKVPVDTRLRIIKDRQIEERQRKLEEIKAQALAAQKFKEQKEEERRMRLEELRVKDEVRRNQVEERKRAINDAEKNRLEFILKRNQEREHRIESKKRNERSNPVFAFGSSTPRMLEPVDLSVSFWGHRKATSIQNISTSSSAASNSLTRRQSERDLDVGNKKRATSATGLERSGENNIPTVPAGCVSGYQGRRRTDLVPTIPTRDSSFTSSRKSLNHSPGRAYSMTRLDQLAKPRRRPDLPSLDESHSPHSRPLSSSRVSSVTRSMSHLAVGKPKPSPTVKLNKADSRSMHQLAGNGVTVAPRTTRTTQLRERKLHGSSNNIEASSRPSSSLSQQSTNSVTSSTSVRHRISAAPRKPRPASIAVTGVTHEAKPPLPKTRKSISKSTEAAKTKIKSPVESKPKEVTNSSQIITKAIDESQKKPPDVSSTEKKEVKVEIKPAAIIADVPKIETELKENNVPEVSRNNELELEKNRIKEIKQVDDVSIDVCTETDKQVKNGNVESKLETNHNEKIEPIVETNEISKTQTESIDQVEQGNEKPIAPADVTQEVMKNIETYEKASDQDEDNINKGAGIRTEEEAKAAIAEKRRLVREEMERQAEMARLQKEAEAKAEHERYQKEMEDARQLIEMQRQVEEERLKEAIKEAQQREEEERLKKEEELKLKLLKEEAERKAREDAERQKAELQERLKVEEKEREARRKRVEAIMLRTRGKNNANLASQPSTDDKNENKADENKEQDENKTNEVNGTKIIEEQENSTTNNGKDTEIVDNIIESDIVKNANTIDTLNSTDTINSNNSWRESQQFDSLM